VRNCEVLVLSGIMTWAWTPDTPGTAAISAILAPRAAARRESGAHADSLAGHRI